MADADQGCVLWSDNMVIPVGAPNTPAALGWMDFVYEPKVAADLTAIHHIHLPGGGRQRDPRRTGPELAKNPMVFPSRRFTGELLGPGLAA